MSCINGHNETILSLKIGKKPRFSGLFLGNSGLNDGKIIKKGRKTQQKRKKTDQKIKSLSHAPTSSPTSRQAIISGLEFIIHLLQGDAPDKKIQSTIEIE